MMTDRMLSEPDITVKMKTTQRGCWKLGEVQQLHTSGQRAIHDTHQVWSEQQIDDALKHLWPPHDGYQIDLALHYAHAQQGKPDRTLH